MTLRRWLAFALRRGRVRVLRSLDAYALWADTYVPAAHNALMAAEETAVRAVLPSMKGHVILDLACGTGRYTRIAEEYGAERVIAIDNSLPMLRAGRTAGTLTGPMVLTAAAGLTSLPLTAACVDGVVCGLALGHLPLLERAISEIARVLRPQGWAAISDVHPGLFLHGAQRTFQTAGRTYAVEHTVHLAADYLAAGQSAGLHLVDLREPRLVTGGQPVASVYLFRKTD